MNTGIVHTKKKRKEKAQNPAFVTDDSSSLSSEQTAFFKIIPQ